MLLEASVLVIVTWFVPDLSGTGSVVHPDPGFHAALPELPRSVENVTAPALVAVVVPLKTIEPPVAGPLTMQFERVQEVELPVIVTTSAPPNSYAPISQLPPGGCGRETPAKS